MSVFDRLLKALGKEDSDVQPETPHDGSEARPATDPVSVWASAQGYVASATPADDGLTLAGKVGDKDWLLTRGPSSRDFIEGEELHARAALGVASDASVVIMSRPLKEDLEKQAYAIYTDSLQTTVNTSLPEEMRWLAMYEEVVWDGLASEFLERYAVLADDLEHAVAWLESGLVDSLMHWPDAQTARQAPFMLMTMRGNVYMRMEYLPADLPTLQHAVAVLNLGCESALKNLAG